MRKKDKTSPGEASPEPKKKLKKWQIILIVILILAFLGSLMGGGDKKESDSSASKIETESKETKEDTKDEPVEEPEPEKPQVQSWGEGMYKVGTDIPAGEYRLIASFSGYFQIASDSTGSLDSIIANDNFDTSSIITVSDGQYLTLSRCDAYTFGQGPSADITKEGMFKVGYDLPAGEYKIHSDSDGYVEVSSDSTHNLYSIVSNNNFSGDSYITVSDGQYLKLARANIVQ